MKFECLQNVATNEELLGAVYGGTAERRRALQDLGGVRRRRGRENGQGGALLPHGGPLRGALLRRLNRMRELVLNHTFVCRFAWLVRRLVSSTVLCHVYCNVDYTCCLLCLAQTLQYSRTTESNDTNINNDNNSSNDNSSNNNNDSKNDSNGQ